MTHNALVVLDLNGLLCRKLSRRVPKNAITNNIVRCPSYDVQLRPYCKEFMDHMLQHYRVGFYSSTTEKNAKPISDALVTIGPSPIIEECQQFVNDTPIDQSHVLFYWFRDRTRPDPERGGFETIKLVSDIRLEYDYEKVLLVDDSSDKLRFNNPDDVLVCKSYDSDNDNDGEYLLELIDEIDRRMVDCD